MVDIEVETRRNMVRYGSQHIRHLPILLDISLVRFVILKLVASQAMAMGQGGPVQHGDHHQQAQQVHHCLQGILKIKIVTSLDDLNTAQAAQHNNFWFKTTFLSIKLDS